MPKRLQDWIVPPKSKRLLVLLGILSAVYIGDAWYRHWRPIHTVETEHYQISSSATLAQTRDVANVIEVLHQTYARVFGSFPHVQQPHPKLQLKLYKDSQEIHRCNRGLGWGEAFYEKPYCHAYYETSQSNPYAWMFHEAVHQLNREAAQIDLPQWIDEGLSTYFSASVLTNGILYLGQIDRGAYPICWLEDFMWTGDIEQDIAHGKIIPLRAIISNHGGPSLGENVNLYYIHWWSLAHFLFEYEGGKYRAGFMRVIQESGTLASFEKHIGPIERIQAQWHQHLQKAKDSL